ncbi:hypothetical protein [Duganella levis]|uniref:DUF1090 family protein n=1 Tax=Duganella levis TaxID=2692169 RepID=A0ABW9VXU7_9BURK|nr:hypothetical protein [Duganella levis]MYN26477.1 hypothetical protein [Duganella levis]
MKVLKMLRMLFFSFFLMPALCSATGQGEFKSRSQCMAKCMADPSAVPERQEKHDEVINDLKAKIKQESDPKKIKDLQDREESEVQKFLDQHEKFCTSICKYFPDN